MNCPIRLAGSSILGCRNLCVLWGPATVSWLRNRLPRGQERRPCIPFCWLPEPTDLGGKEAVEKLTRSDIQDIIAYEKERVSFRREIIALKKSRRILVGPMIALVFENRETVRFQIQEMMRAERIVEEEAIAHEIEAYNELIPGEGELSATLFVELDDPSRIRRV